ncbi:hypothetical protein [uncultured Roseobacter sp.]|uniref:GNAT family N-acetyltransferase n=1 Tax=uncultured Roseobacter sp. TaxID=114847 RepID=UPI0026065F8D|nr:hypothetical protein [uncultured Roseobacter sp.]
MLRWATPADAPELARVFFAAVREGPSPYTQAQRRAWLPEPPSGERWAFRLARLETVVAESEGRITGFMTVEPRGLHRSCVHFAGASGHRALPQALRPH